MAYEIFDMPYAINLKDGKNVPMRSGRNGSNGRPEPGSLLIWNEGGFFRHTGHVAVVVEASDTFVRLAEQNYDDKVWPEVRSVPGFGCYTSGFVRTGTKLWKRAAGDF